MSRVDQISAQLGIELNITPPLDGNNPHRDYWQRFIQPGSFLGVSIPKSAGVHQTLLNKIGVAETNIRAADNDNINHHGINNISGFQQGFHAFHSWGLAIDINYLTNPYIMNEAGERALNQQLSVVYHRISRFMLGRDSIISRGITLDRQPSGGRWSTRNRDLYYMLADESSAMQDYFSTMQSIRSIENFVQGHHQNYLLAFNFSSSNQSASEPINYENVQRQMMSDWSVLTSRPVPAIQASARPLDNSTRLVGFQTAAPIPRGDRPFDVGRGRTNLQRSPLNGFLDIRFEVVNALVQSNLQWGAIHLGSESGDVMHFETPHNDPLAQRLLNLFQRFP